MSPIRAKRSGSTGGCRRSTMGRRLTVIPWKCQQSGDCCQAVSEVAMTKEEAEALRPHVDPAIWQKLQWSPGPPSTVGTFILLKANPCPLLTTDNLCSVHAVRPYNCRRFACLRIPGEQFEPDHGEFGCANVRDRIDDRSARRFLAKLQRKAQRWALSHGWRNV